MFSAITLENHAKKLATPSSILLFKSSKSSLQSILSSISSTSFPFLSNSVILEPFSKPFISGSSFSSIASMI
ncbi:hypothetical protein N406_07545 [Helicobacter pylori FD577]|nr:hypothetical protein N406_07545 [Helicobacter pylori FD577]